MFTIIQPFVASMVRQAITTAAGYLVAAGLIQANQVQTFVAACLLFGGIAWSLWQKINTPDMLGRLSARAADKSRNAKKAWVGSVLQQSPLIIAGFVVLSLLAPKAEAQVRWPWEPAPVAKPKAKKVPLAEPVHRMDAGLVSLITGGANPLDQLWAGIQAATLEDLQYAKALADAIPDNPAARARSVCWAAWIKVLSQQTSAAATINGAPPKASLFTKFEQLAQVAENLQPMSEFHIACAPVAQAMKLQLSQFVLAVVGGGLSLAKFVP